MDNKILITTQLDIELKYIKLRKNLENSFEYLFVNKKDCKYIYNTILILKQKYKEVFPHINDLERVQNTLQQINNSNTTTFNFISDLCIINLHIDVVKELSYYFEGGTLNNDVIQINNTEFFNSKFEKIEKLIVETNSLLREQINNILAIEENTKK